MQEMAVLIKGFTLTAVVSGEAIMIQCQINNKNGLNMSHCD